MTDASVDDAQRGAGAGDRPQRGGRRRPRVVLGVAGGIAAYKAAHVLRELTESGHDVRVIPTRVRAALRRCCDVGGAVRPAGRDRCVDRCRRGAPCPARPRGRPGARGAGHCGFAGEGRNRTRRRPAHRDAADRPLPRALRPGHAHRDVGAPGHPGQRGDLARARCAGPGPCRRPADRGRQRRRAAARSGGDHSSGPGRPRTRRAIAGSRRPACGGQRRRHPGVPGPGAVPGQPVEWPPGLCPGSGRRGPRRDSDTGQCQCRPGRRGGGCRGAGRVRRGPPRGRAATPPAARTLS